MVWTFLEKRLNAPGNLRLLHIAPEPCLRANIERIPGMDYWTSSIDGRGARIAADITRLPFEDSSFDGLICNHVLEHVIDDQTAMNELARVLRKGAWAVLQVPIDSSRKHTFEDHTITSPADRERVFGQNDHVRIYGLDYEDRLRRSGFLVERIEASSIAPGGAEKIGLDADEPMFFCRVG